MVYACVSAIETYSIFKSLSTCIWPQCDWVHALRILRVKEFRRLMKSSGVYDGPNGSLFISILLHNSEFCIPNSEICTANFGIRNCEVYVVWASGNS